MFPTPIDKASGATRLLYKVALPISLVLWLVMRYSVLIIKVIRESGVVLMSRIAGLLLSAIAVQLIADAIFQFIDQGGAG